MCKLRLVSLNGSRGPSERIQSNRLITHRQTNRYRHCILFAFNFLRRSPSCPETHYVEQDGLDHTEISQPLPHLAFMLFWDSVSCSSDGLELTMLRIASNFWSSCSADIYKCVPLKQEGRVGEAEVQEVQGFLTSGTETQLRELKCWTHEWLSKPPRASGF